MKIPKNVLILFVIGTVFAPSVALAVCPVCAISVAGGVGISRWLGIDDVISGL